MALHAPTNQKPDLKAWTTSDSDIDHLEKSPEMVEDSNQKVLAASHETVTVDQSLVRRIVRRTDIHLLTLCVAINIFNFIDRSNIGNARILGLQHDLKLTGVKYNIAVMCTFISAAAIEVPGNIVCKLIGPRFWISAIVVIFSIITICTALVESASGLYAARFFLGVFEGSVSPSIIFALSLL